MNIVYSSDNNYVKYMSISMVSLFENNANADDIFIYIIDNGIHNKQKGELIALADKYKRNIEFVSFQREIKDLKLNCNFPASAFGRLFLGKLINVHKIIYLDCDTVVVSDLHDFWNTDLQSKTIGGIQDSVNEFFLLCLGMNNDERYINSGVLLVNLDRWREKNFEQRCITYIQQNDGCVPHNDQGVINAVCKGDIFIIHPRYNLLNPMLVFNCMQIKRLSKTVNYYKQKEIDEAKATPAVVHFTEEFYNRPWFKNCTHPLKNYYLKYAEYVPNGLQLDNKLISKNAKIMSIVQKRFPFFCYCLMMNLITFKKKFQLKNRKMIVRYDHGYYQKVFKRHTS